MVSNKGSAQVLLDTQIMVVSGGTLSILLICLTDDVPVKIGMVGKKMLIAIDLQSLPFLIQKFPIIVFDVINESIIAKSGIYKFKTT